MMLTLIFADKLICCTFANEMYAIHDINNK